jgi:hypothetical protein
MLASTGLRPVLNGQHSKHFSLEAWHTLGREEYPGLKWTTLNREGPMSYVFAILAAFFECNGHLRSAGHASWPVYCRARQL